MDAFPLPENWISKILRHWGMKCHTLVRIVETPRAVFADGAPFFRYE